MEEARRGVSPTPPPKTNQQLQKEAAEHRKIIQASRARSFDLQLDEFNHRQIFRDPDQTNPYKVSLGAPTYDCTYGPERSQRLLEDHKQHKANEERNARIRSQFRTSGMFNGNNATKPAGVIELKEKAQFAIIWRGPNLYQCGFCSKRRKLPAKIQQHILRTHIAYNVFGEPEALYCSDNTSDEEGDSKKEETQDRSAAIKRCKEEASSQAATKLKLDNFKKDAAARAQELEPDFQQRTSSKEKLAICKAEAASRARQSSVGGKSDAKKKAVAVAKTVKVKAEAEGRSRHSKSGKKSSKDKTKSDDKVKTTKVEQREAQPNNVVEDDDINLYEGENAPDNAVDLYGGMETDGITVQKGTDGAKQFEAAVNVAISNNVEQTPEEQKPAEQTAAKEKLPEAKSERTLRKRTPIKKKQEAVFGALSSSSGGSSTGGTSSDSSSEVE